MGRIINGTAPVWQLFWDLSSYPDFYSGDDAGYYALNSAALCHQAFKDTYKAFRNSFTSILKDAGLGIGIYY
jgi:hypothetical protein